jgi:hypothetical protein
MHIVEQVVHSLMAVKRKAQSKLTRTANSCATQCTTVRCPVSTECHIRICDQKHWQSVLSTVCLKTENSLISRIEHQTDNRVCDLKKFDEEQNLNFFKMMFHSEMILLMIYTFID